MDCLGQIDPSRRLDLQSTTTGLTEKYDAVITAQHALTQQESPTSVDLIGAAPKWLARNENAAALFKAIATALSSRTHRPSCGLGQIS